MMRKIQSPKIGEYVLLCRWGDHDPCDPWYVGFFQGKMQLTPNGDFYYKVFESERWFQNCFRISAEEGAEILKTYPEIEKNLFGRIPCQK